MRTRSILISLMLCASCGEARNVGSSMSSVSATDSSAVPATDPTTTSVDPAATVPTLAGDRVAYVSTRSTAAEQTPEEALTQTLAGLSDVIHSAVLVTPASDATDPTGMSLDITVAADGRALVQGLEGDWEAALLLGAVADRTTRDGHMASEIKGWTVEHVPAGETDESLWEPTNNSMVPHQKFLPPGDDAEIKRTVDDALARYNLEALSVDVLHPLDTAIKVIAIIDSPEAMNGQLSQLQTELTGTPIQYEGVYLEVRLPDNSPIAVLASAFRDGSGTQWVRPDLEDVLGGPPHG
jgi:hypothetical protein